MSIFLVRVRAAALILIQSASSSSLSGTVIPAALPTHRSSSHPRQHPKSHGWPRFGHGLVSLGCTPCQHKHRCKIQLNVETLLQSSVALLYLLSSIWATSNFQPEFPINVFPNEVLQNLHISISIPRHLLDGHHHFHAACLPHHHNSNNKIPMKNQSCFATTTRTLRLQEPAKALPK